jgi:hypothetical protein
VQAAPALKSWANLRREIEMLFILKPPSGGDIAISGELRDGKLPFFEAAVSAARFEDATAFFLATISGALFSLAVASAKAAAPV